MFVPLYPVMIASAAARAFETISSTMACSSTRVSTPEPSFAVAAIAPSTEARFADVTPVTPIRAKSAAVRVVVPPAAAVMMPVTTSPSAYSSAAVSTCAVVAVSRMRFISARSAAISMELMPIAAYCEATNWALLLRVPSAAASTAV